MPKGNIGGKRGKVVSDRAFMKDLAENYDKFTTSDLQAYVMARIVDEIGDDDIREVYRRTDEIIQKAEKKYYSMKPTEESAREALRQLRNFSVGDSVDANNIEIEKHSSFYTVKGKGFSSDGVDLRNESDVVRYLKNGNYLRK